VKKLKTQLSQPPDEIERF